MKPIIVTLSSVILLAGCSASYQAQQQTGTKAGDVDVAQPYGDTTATKKITSLKGYQPTENDVIKFHNDVRSFLEAYVPNFSKYNKALIIIDDVQADSLIQVSLSEIKLISVLDSSSAVILGSTAAGGAIVIRTK